MTADAPYGYKPDGTPYKRNPAAYANRSPRGTKAKSPGRDRGARQAGLEEFLGLPVAVLAMVGHMNGQTAFVADAVVCAQAVPQVAGSVAELAESNDSIARAVDSLTKATPYTALVGCLVPLAIQLGVNHSPRLAEIVRPFGFQGPEEIIAGVGGSGDGGSGDSSSA